MADYLLIGGPWHGRVKSVPDNVYTLYLYRQLVRVVSFNPSEVRVVDPEVEKHKYDLHRARGAMMPIDADFQGYGIYQGVSK